MEVYASEEEQIQIIKDWWKKNGMTIIIAIAVFLAASFGWRYFAQYKNGRLEQASVLYSQVFAADMEHKSDDLALYAKHLMDDYGGTPYASLSALLLARQNVNDKQLPQAKDNLQWVIDHTNSSSLRQIARVRLARVLLAMNQANAALQLLQKVDDKDFAELTNEAKGDIYLALGNKEEALASYQAALNSVNQISGSTAVLQMKINYLKHD